MASASPYTCRACGVAVIIAGDTIVRACPHDDAAVAANIGANVYGLAALREMTVEDRAARGL